MESDLPCVPHLFVQRIDALPDDVLDGVLTALAQQAKEPSAPSWLQKLGWFSDHALSRADEQQSKAELRDLLRKHRRDELPADADTADLSSEPYDSIPRQVRNWPELMSPTWQESAKSDRCRAALIHAPTQSHLPSKHPSDMSHHSPGLALYPHFLLISALGLSSVASFSNPHPVHAPSNPRADTAAMARVRKVSARISTPKP